jgi:integral membrane protein
MSAGARFRLFRQVAFVEGVTTLALFLVAMPIKYLAGNPEPVRITGWIHGVAFIAYVLMMWVALRGRGWSVPDLARTFAASLFPFGTFANDKWLRQREPSDRGYPG